MKNIFSLNRKTIVNTIGLIFFLILPFLTQLFDQEYLISLFSLILIYGLAAASLDLILGFGGMISLGHAVFMGIGGYTVGIFAYHKYDSSLLFGFAGSENGLITWLLAILAAAIFGLITGAISLRTKGMYFIMITLAFAQMGYYFFVSLSQYGGSDGMSLYNRNELFSFDLGDDVTFYYVCLTILLTFLLIAHRIVNSHFGKVIKACKQNEQRVQVLGIASYRYKLAIYTFAAAVAGLSGALLANQNEFASPELMHWTKSGELMVMVILGGMGTLFGPVLGAATFLLMEYYLAMYTEHWMVVLGPFLIIVVLFAKKGLYGLLVGSKDTDD
ncbi:MAG: branched-chain amino acid ABC transporter permease [Campylobacterota bacterium]|nr:branched-chain amino acid ABC transporter permease [Campylobacterota bacterium]